MMGYDFTHLKDIIRGLFKRKTKSKSEEKSKTYTGSPFANFTFEERVMWEKQSEEHMNELTRIEREKDYAASQRQKQRDEDAR